MGYWVRKSKTISALVCIVMLQLPAKEARSVDFTTLSALIAAGFVAVKEGIKCCLPLCRSASCMRCCSGMNRNLCGCCLPEDERDGACFGCMQQSRMSRFMAPLSLYGDQESLRDTVQDMLSNVMTNSTYLKVLEEDPEAQSYGAIYGTNNRNLFYYHAGRLSIDSHPLEYCYPLGNTKLPKLFCRLLNHFITNNEELKKQTIRHVNQYHSLGSLALARQTVEGEDLPKGVLMFLIGKLDRSNAALTLAARIIFAPNLVENDTRLPFVKKLSEDWKRSADQLDLSALLSAVENEEKQRWEKENWKKHTQTVEWATEAFERMATDSETSPSVGTEDLSQARGEKEEERSRLMTQSGARASGGSSSGSRRTYSPLHASRRQTRHPSMTRAANSSSDTEENKKMPGSILASDRRSGSAATRSVSFDLPPYEPSSSLRRGGASTSSSTSSATDKMDPGTQL